MLGDRFNALADQTMVSEANLNLTARERFVLESKLLDLALGYPELPNPEWLDAIWYEKTLGEILAIFCRTEPEIRATIFESMPSSAVLESAYLRGALGLLGFDSAVLSESAFATLSGSISLAAAIRAAIPKNGRVLVQAPVFDVIPALVADRTQNITWLPVNWSTGQWAVDRVRCEEPVDAVLLVSPDNPSGAVLDQSTLNAICGLKCINERTVFLVDHCFVLLAPEPLPLLPTLLSRSQPWIVVWDTGKTFDLDDEKLGAIFCSSELRAAIRHELDVFQCTLPRRTLMQLFLVLARVPGTGYLKWLWELRSRNLSLVREFCAARRLPVISGPAGAFALIGDMPIDSSLLLKRAASRGLGLASTESFHPVNDTSQSIPPMLRIPLLRDPRMMASALTIVADCL